MAHNVFFFSTLSILAAFPLLARKKKGEKKTAHFYCFENVTIFFLRLFCGNFFFSSVLAFMFLFGSCVFLNNFL